ncbi:MAG: hypothetical protein ABI459_06545, partial [Deltaproteobacteria bacterium]
MTKFARVLVRMAVLFGLAMSAPIAAIAYLAAVLSRKAIVFPVVFAALWLASAGVAPQFGRVALPCGGDVL